MSDKNQKQILTSKEAAFHLGVSQGSLKQARLSGQMFGVPGPAFLKMGYRVRYNLSTLDKWLSQFSEQQTTIKGK